jgi:hypothetical protein
MEATFSGYVVYLMTVSEHCTGYVTDRKRILLMPACEMAVEPGLWNAQQERCPLHDFRWLVIREKLGEDRLYLEEESEVKIQL